RAGARVCEAHSPEALDLVVSHWGYHGVGRALSDYSRGVAAREELNPPRLRYRRPLRPPFFAIEVQPAITFTFGGLHVDAAMRVLGEDGAPIRGLYAAGADVGGVFCEQYVSGLTLAATTAFRAVTSISLASPGP